MDEMTKAKPNPSAVHKIIASEIEQRKKESELHLERLRKELERYEREIDLYTISSANEK